MNKTLVALLSILFICSCTSQNEENSEANEPTNDAIPLVIDSMHSKMHGQGIPYKLKSTDSLVFDISKYNFKLLGEQYDFIRENIVYREVLGTSFGFVDFVYNDSLDLMIRVKEIEKDKVFIMPHAIDSLNQYGVKEFDIVFTFYLDNGFGSDVIDVFPVEIVD